MTVKAIHLLLVCIVAARADEDWTKKCNKCKCMWVSGKRTADCTNVSLTSIPNDLSSAIREIDFSYNFLYEIQNNALEAASLRDIHKLKFQNCSIEAIYPNSFKGLQLLIELDLSKNSLSTLDKNAFHDNVKLRILVLSYNKIKVIEDGLFWNMTFLQRVLLDHNEIEVISEGTFVLLPTLQHINLGFNKIKRITFELKKNLPKLNSLSVEGNPWVCDCELQEFKQKSLASNLITTPTECNEPEKLHGTIWSESIYFACTPQIIYPEISTKIEATSSNVTLSCKVTGDPQPDVNWLVNGRILDRDPRQSKQKYDTQTSKIGEYSWNNLTIINVNYRDRGEYKCVATNPGGVDERNITLNVSAGSSSGGASPLGNSLPWIIGLSVVVIVILIIILILICCFCKRSTHGMNSKRRDGSNTSEEYISMQGQPDMKKGLITEVNPVVKPPRSSVPGSLNSGGTEVSDVKRTLLDNESCFEGEDETRSVDYGQISQKSLFADNSDYPYNHPYPPDLLSFPPMAIQVSPAGSSASTVADTTRLPPHHGPQSPMHSPMYDQLSLYRTLPYSRSHSPFVGPPRVPRPGQGYVTIPRRPRQSWSSEPPSASDFITEPLYDNLGLRTTVDGSSALSLNKLGEVASPRSNKMFPLSPTNCDPIAEHDSSSPVSAATLPRSHHSQLSPSRTNWAKANAEALRSPEKRNSTASLPPSEGKSTKIPPRPPPKPKKRLSTGPLFEDEGEDGTEV